MVIKIDMDVEVSPGPAPVTDSADIVSQSDGMQEGDDGSSTGDVHEAITRTVSEDDAEQVDEPGAVRTDDSDSDSDSSEDTDTVKQQVDEVNTIDNAEGDIDMPPSTVDDDDTETESVLTAETKESKVGLDASDTAKNEVVTDEDEDDGLAKTTKDTSKSAYNERVIREDGESTTTDGREDDATVSERKEDDDENVGLANENLDSEVEEGSLERMDDGDSEGSTIIEEEFVEDSSPNMHQSSESLYEEEEIVVDEEYEEVTEGSEDFLEEEILEDDTYEEVVVVGNANNTENDPAIAHIETADEDEDDDQSTVSSGGVDIMPPIEEVDEMSTMSMRSEEFSRAASSGRYEPGRSNHTGEEVLLGSVNENAMDIDESEEFTPPPSQDGLSDPGTPERQNEAERGASIHESPDEVMDTPSAEELETPLVANRTLDSMETPDMDEPEAKKPRVEVRAFPNLEEYDDKPRTKPSADASFQLSGSVFEMPSDSSESPQNASPMSQEDGEGPTFESTKEEDDEEEEVEEEDDEVNDEDELKEEVGDSRFEGDGGNLSIGDGAVTPATAAMGSRTPQPFQADPGETTGAQALKQAQGVVRLETQASLGEGTGRQIEDPESREQNVEESSSTSSSEEESSESSSSETSETGSDQNEDDRVTNISAPIALPNLKGGISSGHSQVDDTHFSTSDEATLMGLPNPKRDGSLPGTTAQHEMQLPKPIVSSTPDEAFPAQQQNRSTQPHESTSEFSQAQSENDPFSALAARPGPSGFPGSTNSADGSILQQSSEVPVAGSTDQTNQHFASSPVRPRPGQARRRLSLQAQKAEEEMVYDAPQPSKMKFDLPSIPTYEERTAHPEPPGPHPANSSIAQQSGRSNEVLATKFTDQTNQHSTSSPVRPRHGRASRRLSLRAQKAEEEMVYDAPQPSKMKFDLPSIPTYEERTAHPEPPGPLPANSSIAQQSGRSSEVLATESTDQTNQHSTSSPVRPRHGRASRRLSLRAQKAEEEMVYDAPQPSTMKFDLPSIPTYEERTAHPEPSGPYPANDSIAQQSGQPTEGTATLAPDQLKQHSDHNPVRPRHGRASRRLSLRAQKAEEEMVYDTPQPSKLKFDLPSLPAYEERQKLGQSGDSQHERIEPFANFEIQQSSEPESNHPSTRVRHRRPEAPLPSRLPVSDDIERGEVDSQENDDDDRVKELLEEEENDSAFASPLFLCLICLVCLLAIALAILLWFFLFRDDDGPQRTLAVPTNAPSAPSAPSEEMPTSAPIASPLSYVEAFGPFTAPTASGFGTGLALVDDTLLIGSPGVGAGTVLSQRLGGDSSTSSVNGEQAGSGFGWSVDLSESVMVVGSPFLFANGTPTEAGGVYAYERSGSTWMQIGDVIRGQEDQFAANEDFGASVAVASIGTSHRIVVGAPYSNLNDFEIGRVYTFERASVADMRWINIDQSPLLGEKSGDRFGSSVDISDDGSSFLAGGPGGDLHDGAGLVFMYKFSGNLEMPWDLAFAIEGIEENERFGASVAFLSDDGDTFAIGAPDYRNGSGRVSVYRKSNRGLYEQVGDDIVGNPGEKIGEARLMEGGVSTRRLHIVVATSDGVVRRYDFAENEDSWKVVFDDLDPGFDGLRSLKVFGVGAASIAVSSSSTGRVAVFDASGTLPVVPAAPTTPVAPPMTVEPTQAPYQTSAPTFSDLFEWGQVGGPFSINYPQSGYGNSLALTKSFMAVGAPFALTSGGSVLTYVQAEDGSWSPLDELYGEEESDGFGFSLHADGNALIIGAPFVEGVGAAYFYELVDNEWAQLGSPLLGDVGTNGFLGSAVAASSMSRIAVVGASGYTDEFIGRGAFYIYEFSNSNGWTMIGSNIGFEEGDALGQAVDVDPSGTIVIAGAPGNGAGYAMVYEKIGDKWENTLLPQGAPGDALGTTVKVLSNDYIAVGAPGYSGGRGRIIVYERQEEGFIRMSEVVGMEGDQLGSSLKLTGAGTTLVVGKANGQMLRLDFDGATSKWIQITRAVKSGFGSGLRAVAIPVGDPSVFAVSGGERALIYNLTADV